MHLASPNVRRFLVLHLLLLLSALGFQAPMTQQHCTGIIDEILDDLRKPSLPSSHRRVLGRSSIDHEDRLILKDQSLLKANLYVFQETLETLKGNSSKIWKNLQGLEQCLPPGSEEGYPVVFTNSSWGEFRDKLIYYLQELRPKPWLMKNVESATSSHYKSPKPRGVPVLQ